MSQHTRDGVQYKQTYGEGRGMGWGVGGGGPASKQLLRGEQGSWSQKRASREHGLQGCMTGTYFVRGSFDRRWIGGGDMFAGRVLDLMYWDLLRRPVRMSTKILGVC